MLILSLILIAVEIIGDQYFKYLAVQNLAGGRIITGIPNLLNFEYVENKGMAFGMLGGHTMILSVITAVCVAAVFVMMILYRKHSGFSRAAAILVIGGGIGNLIDRFMLGYVVDYIKISFFPPVFNLADCFVVVGVAAFIIHFLFFAEKDEKIEKVMHTRR